MKPLAHCLCSFFLAGLSILVLFYPNLLFFQKGLVGESGSLSYYFDSWYKVLIYCTSLLSLRFYIFASLINGGSAFYWLVVIGGINSVISLYYYLRVVKVMYFDGERSDEISFPSRALTGALIVTALPSLILGIYWNPVANWIYNSLVFFTQTL